LSLPNPEKSLAFSESRLRAFGGWAVDLADLTGGNHQGVMLKTFATDTSGGDRVQDAPFMGMGDRSELERRKVFREL
jgi:hypothetical protein